MKFLTKLTLLVLVMVSYTSCDQLDELTEFDFNTTLDETLFVALQAGVDQPFNQTTTFNIENEDTMDYLDLLQDVEITSFTYRLVNFSGDPNATIVGNFQADGTTLVAHDMVIKTEVDAGTVFTVTDVNALNTIATSLKNGNNISVGLSGSYSCEDTTSFIIEMTIGLAITADVL